MSGHIQVTHDIFIGICMIKIIIKKNSKTKKTQDFQLFKKY